MPFDAAMTANTVTFSEASREVFDGAGDIDPAWALENPEQALAVLMLAPRPCAALDALLGL